MDEACVFDEVDTLVAFRQRSSARVESLSLSDGFELLMNFYEKCRAADALPLWEGGDMLLFQWGTYDSGIGENFEVNLTRQVIFPADEDGNVSGDEDPEIWQLRLTYYFTPKEEFRVLGAGNRWCEQPNDLAQFRNFVLTSHQVDVAAKHRSETAKLVWESAE